MTFLYARTLNLRYPHVIINFPDDENGFTCRHRVLLNKVLPGVWMCLTPDHEVSEHHLNDLLHQVLGTDSEFLAAYAPFVYAHDPISTAQLEKFWLIAGRRACKDFLQGAVLGPGTLVLYHHDWMRTSPFGARFAGALDHRILMKALKLSLSADQLHIINLPSFEQIRRVVQKEVAILCHPKQPDFSGLQQLIYVKERRHLRNQGKGGGKSREGKNSQGKGGGKTRKGKKDDGGPPGGEPAGSK